MSYTIRQQLLPQSKYSLKSPYVMTPKTVTIHNTANDAPAKNEANYMLSNDEATSFHVAVDDIEAVELIPFNRNAWHAGDKANGPGNRTSVGIEICYSKSGGERYRKAEQNTIDYTARLLIRLGLGARDVRYHKEWSGKNCPHRIIAEKREKAVKDAIAKRYEELKKGDIKPQSPPPKLDPPKGKKIGTATMLQDVQAYARPAFGTQTKTVFKKGNVRHIYAIENGWYKTFSGEYIPSNYGKNFKYVPNKPSKPPSPTRKRQVTIDGKPTGTFTEEQNVLKEVERAMKENAKTIEIKEVK